MNTQVKQNDKGCEDCYEIKCTNCGWKPDRTQLKKVMAGKLTVCPDCGFAK